MERFINICAAKSMDLSPKQEGFGMHMHNNYEIFCFLTGNANYIVEGTSYSLHKGDLVVMRPAESHHICFLSEAVYRRMCVNFCLSNPKESLTEKLIIPFENRSLGSFNHYPSAHFSNSDLIHYMEKLCETDKESLQSAYLTVLLNEISDQFENIKQIKNNSEKNISAAVVRYINAHLTEEISLSKLSDYFSISKSQLNRNFKNIIGSTVWEYVKKKRLLLAQKLINEGSNPTKVYLDCGFKDYTAFYRAYCIQFGFSPSKTSRMF